MLKPYHRRLAEATPGNFKANEITKVLKQLQAMDAATANKLLADEVLGIKINEIVSKDSFYLTNNKLTGSFSVTTTDDGEEMFDVYLSYDFVKRAFEGSV